MIKNYLLFLLNLMLAINVYGQGHSTETGYSEVIVQNNTPYKINIQIGNERAVVTKLKTIKGQNLGKQGTSYAISFSDQETYNAIIKPINYREKIFTWGGKYSGKDTADLWYKKQFHSNVDVYIMAIKIEYHISDEDTYIMTITPVEVSSSQIEEAGGGAAAVNFFKLFMGLGFINLKINTF